MEGILQNYLRYHTLYSTNSMNLKLGRKMFSQNEILRFLANIIIIVFDINSRNIYHRDLKPANFLIKTDHNGKIYLHLNDFGTSKSSIIDGMRLNTTVGNPKGTQCYLAPEIIKATSEFPVMSK
jgi:serine/threonine protein kinase